MWGFPCLLCPHGIFSQEVFQADIPVSSTFLQHLYVSRFSVFCQKSQALLIPINAWLQPFPDLAEGFAALAVQPGQMDVTGTWAGACLQIHFYSKAFVGHPFTSQVSNWTALWTSCCAVPVTRPADFYLHMVFSLLFQQVLLPVTLSVCENNINSALGHFLWW